MEVEPREIEIYEIQLLTTNKEQKQIEFRVHCSKGTYMRSLCEDIAQKLNTVGYMSALHRTKVGDFSIEQAITIQQMQEGNLSCITIEELFQNKPKITITKNRLTPFLNGVKLTMKEPDGVYRIDCEDEYEEKFLGIGVVENEFLKRDIVI